MDLLEYMRSQDNMTQAEWERTFEEEEREILVLLAGGSGAGKRACLIVCVSVFCLKGLMHDE